VQCFSDYCQAYMMPGFDFYRMHLTNVSRSFSFCIEELKFPLKQWVACAYLLCRMVDSIEDSQWENKKSQLQAFSQFNSFLMQLPSADDYNRWYFTLPDMSPEEKKLLQDGFFILEDLIQVDIYVRREILECVQMMVRGMIYFTSKQVGNNQIKMTSFQETTLYCYFVAGTVGIMLTKLNAMVCQGFLVDDLILQQSIQFGLFLQKINILKDQLNDEAQGRFFISCRESLVKQIGIHARFAMKYIKSIPVVAGREYRLFCAWSLFIGLASLPWINKSFLQQEIVTIPQKITLDLIEKIKELIDDNIALEKLFYRYLLAAGLEGNDENYQSNSIFPNTQSIAVISG
jgi:phytoene/squalene synthetase